MHTLLSSVFHRWGRIPGNARGAMWILLAALGFSVMTVCIKILGQVMSVWEVLALRAAFAFIVLSPAIWRASPQVFVTRRPLDHLVRSAMGMGGIICLFFALQHLDLALATTLGFTRTLFIIVLAVEFLGEVIRWRRTAATVVGFAGVIICVQPGVQFDSWTLVGLGAALFSAGVTTTVKRLTTTEPPLTILVWTYLIMGTMASFPALVDWKTPTVGELLVVIGMGLAAMGQGCMVHGLRAIRPR